MANIREAIPSKYIKNADLKGQPVPVIIERYALEEVGMAKELRGVLYFQGHTKGVILNAGKIDVLSGLYGEETDSYIGKPITMIPTTTQFQGNPHYPNIGFRATAPTDVAPAPIVAPMQQPAPAAVGPDGEPGYDPGSEDNIPF